MKYLWQLLGVPEHFLGLPLTSQAGLDFSPLFFCFELLFLSKFSYQSLISAPVVMGDLNALQSLYR